MTYFSIILFGRGVYEGETARLYGRYEDQLVKIGTEARDERDCDGPGRPEEWRIRVRQIILMVCGRHLSYIEKTDSSFLLSHHFSSLFLLSFLPSFFPLSHMPFVPGPPYPPPILPLVQLRRPRRIHRGGGGLLKLEKILPKKT